VILGEPAPTQADLRFSIFGFPVRVHPFFWVLCIILIINSSNIDLKQLLIWTAVVFVSILIHELGHAFMVRYYGGRPWITLHAFGGLCSYQPIHRGPLSNILISIAGPSAGFLFLAIVLSGIHAAGFPVVFVYLFNFLPMPIVAVEFPSPELNTLVWDLIYVNYFWGLLNLLPLYPLDGGQISRELFMLGNPQTGVVQSLWLSVFTGAIIAVLAITKLESIFMALMFGYLAYTSWATIQAYTGRGGYGGGPTRRGW